MPRETSSAAAVLGARDLPRSNDNRTAGLDRDVPRLRATVRGEGELRLGRDPGVLHGLAGAVAARFAASSAFAVFFTSGVGDCCASKTAGGSISAIVARISSTLFMALAPPVFSGPFMENSVEVSMGDATSAGGKNYEKSDD